MNPYDEARFDFDEDDERPDVFDLLDQDQIWVPADGRAIALEDMGPRHRRNTLRFLRRNAAGYGLSIAMATMSDDMGEQAAVDVMSGLHAGWIEEEPLVIRLSELVEQDQRNDTPDEA